MLFLISIELLTILTVVVRVQAIAISLSDSDTRHIGDEINWKNGYSWTVPRFNPEKEEWSAYVECLNYYLVANSIEDDTKKVAILMSNSGPIQSMELFEVW